MRFMIKERGMSDQYVVWLIRDLQKGVGDYVAIIAPRSIKEIIYGDYKKPTRHVVGLIHRAALAACRLLYSLSMAKK